MRWFRDYVRDGAWLALVALVINVALSFGHVHALSGQGGSRGLILAETASSDRGQSQGHTDEDRADYLCPICIATSVMANGLASSPPAAISLQLAETVVERAIEPGRVVLALPRAPFQSRAPPRC